MKKFLAASFLIFLVTEAVQAQRISRNSDRSSYEAEAADQIVIKELQREVLEGIRFARQNRQLTSKEAKGFLKQYGKITNREIKLYRKKRLNERKLAQVRIELENLVQNLYTTTRFDNNNRGGWVKARSY